MAKKPKKITVFIKQNFDIKKYDACYDLNVIDWYNVLLGRHSMFAFHRFGEDEERALNHALSLLADPLIKPKCNEPILGPSDYDPVFDMDIFDILNFRERMLGEPDLRNTVEEYEVLSKNGFSGTPSSELYLSYHSECLKRGGSAEDNMAPILVDLHASDEQLLKAFSKWLSVKREELESFNNANGSSGEKITRKTMLGWAESKVLAFIDLTYVAKSLNTEIPYHLMGDLLYPDDLEVDVGERVRKKTKPLAQKLLNAGFINVLFMAAANYYQERAE